MRHKSVAKDEAQWNGRPLGMYETLKHGAYRLEPVRPSIAQSTVTRVAGRKAKHNTPTQIPRKEIAMTQASQEQTFPRWLLIALLRIVGSSVESVRLVA